jgi:hypothetical protein
VPDCRVIALPPGEDVNSIFIRNGRDGLERMLMSNDE